jgi:hypothetical protein
MGFARIEEKRMGVDFREFSCNKEESAYEKETG